MKTITGEKQFSLAKVAFLKILAWSCTALTPALHSPSWHSPLSVRNDLIDFFPSLALGVIYPRLCLLFHGALLVRSSFLATHLDARCKADAAK